MNGDEVFLIKTVADFQNMLIEAWNGSIYRWHGVSLWWKCLYTPFIYTLFYTIYTFGYFTHTGYTHFLPCVLIIICILCVFYDSIHVLNVYVLFRAISSPIFYLVYQSKSIKCCNQEEYLTWRLTSLGDRGSVYLGNVEETTPQTDSVPSVDRAISCFNKHIYRRHCRQSVVKMPYFHAPWGSRGRWKYTRCPCPLRRRARTRTLEANEGETGGARRRREVWPEQRGRRRRSGKRAEPGSPSEDGRGRDRGGGTPSGQGGGPGSGLWDDPGSGPEGGTWSGPGGRFIERSGRRYTKRSKWW